MFGIFWLQPLLFICCSPNWMQCLARSQQTALWPSWPYVGTKISHLSSVTTRCLLSNWMYDMPILIRMTVALIRIIAGILHIGVWNSHALIELVMSWMMVTDSPNFCVNWNCVCFSILFDFLTFTAKKLSTYSNYS